MLCKDPDCVRIGECVHVPSLPGFTCALDYRKDCPDDEGCCLPASMEERVRLIAAYKESDDYRNRPIQTKCLCGCTP